MNIARSVLEIVLFTASDVSCNQDWVQGERRCEAHDFREGTTCTIIHLQLIADDCSAALLNVACEEVPSHLYALLICKQTSHRWCWRGLGNYLDKSSLGVSAGVLALSFLIQCRNLSHHEISKKQTETIAC